MKKTPLRRKTPLKAKQGFNRLQVASKPRKVTPKRKREKSLAKLKKELDSVFSRYIRQKYSDNQGEVSCYTCGKRGHWKTMQNGHFVSRQYLATRWDENNCRVQCAGCNLFGNGQLLDFEENLKLELGPTFVENMKFMRHQILKLDRVYYETRIRYYKDILKET